MFFDEDTDRPAGSDADAAQDVADTTTGNEDTGADEPSPEDV